MGHGAWGMGHLHYLQEQPLPRASRSVPEETYRRQRAIACLIALLLW